MMAGTDVTSRSDLPEADARRCFIALLGLAMLARLMAFDAFGIHHPDEILQYIEPANRLLNGYGIVTWEYRYGMRAMILPVVLAGPMALGQGIGGTMGGIIAARLFVAALSFAPVLAAWSLGKRMSNTHAIVGMAVMAIWSEQAYFSAHLLMESLATGLFMWAVALTLDRSGPRRWFWGGTLLALTIILRFQYAAAIGIYVLLILRTNWRGWMWMIVGGVPVLLLSSAIDLWFGYWPFQWVLTNIHFNLVEGRSALFGVEPAGWFLGEIWIRMGLLMPLLLLFAVEAGPRMRPLLWAAVANLAVHSLIGHKEYRFIELSMTILVLLAAFGSVNVARKVVGRYKARISNDAMVAVILCLWATASAIVATVETRLKAGYDQTNDLRQMHLAGKDPRICGVGMMVGEYMLTSKAYFGRPVDLYMLNGTPLPGGKLVRPGSEMPSMNAVIADANAGRLLPGYVQRSCSGMQSYRRCLYVRAGGCAPTAEGRRREIQAALLIRDL